MTNFSKRLRREGAERQLDSAAQRRVDINSRIILGLHRTIQQNLGHDLVEGSDLMAYPMHAPQLPEASPVRADDRTYEQLSQPEPEITEPSSDNVRYVNFLANSGMVETPQSELQDAA